MGQKWCSAHHSATTPAPAGSEGTQGLRCTAGMWHVHCAGGGCCRNHSQLRHCRLLCFEACTTNSTFMWSSLGLHSDVWLSPWAYISGLTWAARHIPHEVPLQYSSTHTSRCQQAANTSKRQHAHCSAGLGDYCVLLFLQECTGQSWEISCVQAVLTTTKAAAMWGLQLTAELPGHSACSPMLMQP
jgi:hypothetical protein